MIARALAILEGIKGGPVDAAIANRVIAAFLPEDIDIGALTNEQKAAHFVQEARQMIKLRVLQFEEQMAIEAAMLAARADIEGNVDLGSD